jgi:biotin transport system ATP-binding protein
VIKLVDAGFAVHLPVAGSAPRTRTILEPTTLELSEHRIALIGANGSGKSTLLRLLNGLVHPTTGRVELDGLDTVRDGTRVRREIGFVFTDPLSQLVLATPADDIELSLRRRIRDRGQRRTAALRLLSDAGLADLADQSVYDLSGGERQLVALTSVLATEPSVVLADEPTTLLDLRNRNRVRTALAALEQQLILATHDLDLAADAERVLVIEAGRVVADGTPDDAIPAYLELAAR